MIGGARGQKQQAYLLPAWLDNLKAGSTDFIYSGHQVTAISLFKMAGKRLVQQSKAALRQRANLPYEAQAPELKGISVKVHYDIFDGIPLLSKWLKLPTRAGSPSSCNR